MISGFPSEEHLATRWLYLWWFLCQSARSAKLQKWEKAILRLNEIFFGIHKARIWMQKCVDNVSASTLCALRPFKNIQKKEWQLSEKLMSMFEVFISCYWFIFAVFLTHFIIIQYKKLSRFSWHAFQISEEHFSWSASLSSLSLSVPAGESVEQFIKGVFESAGSHSYDDYVRHGPISKSNWIKRNQIKSNSIEALWIKYKNVWTKKFNLFDHVAIIAIESSSLWWFVIAYSYARFTKSSSRSQIFQGKIVLVRFLCPMINFQLLRWFRCRKLINLRLIFVKCFERFWNVVHMEIKPIDELNETAKNSHSSRDFKSWSMAKHSSTNATCGFHCIIRSASV